MPSDPEHTRLGLTLLTSACLDPDSPSPEHMEIVRQGIEEDPNFEAKALIGMTNMAVWLLVLLEKETGRPMQSFLEHIGQHVAQM